MRDVAPRARLIHSRASHRPRRSSRRHPAREILVQVNVAGEEGKAGIAPADLAAFLGERSRCR